MSAQRTVVVIGLGYPTYKYEEAILQEVGARLVLSEATEPQDVAAAVREADAVLNRTVPIPTSAIEGMQRCKVIARYGIGYDNIDVAACTRKGICVANVPDYCRHDVAEQALALLLAAIRRIVKHDRLIREGQWDICSRYKMFRIHGKTLGLLGFGQIARSLAEKARGLGLRIITHDPYVTPEKACAGGAELVSLETLWKDSDYISIHAPATPQTRHIVNDKALAMMKPTVIIVNTSRGALIDEAALERALREGRIGGAALDVFETEPLPANSPLRTVDNLILSDHEGWYSEESQVELQSRAAQEVARVLRGEWPQNLVNPDVKAVIGSLKP